MSKPRYVECLLFGLRKNSNYQKNNPMTIKQKTALLKLLKDSWSRAYKASASSELLSAIESAIARAELEPA